MPTFATPDGRTIAYELKGPRDGTPVIGLHGTPGSRVSRFPIGDPYADAGVCVAQYDRPGYGGSTRHAGRSVADCAADVAVLADELGWETFAVTGGSGGGPHVLACAALLPDRVVRAICDVGVAPLGPPGLDRDAFLEGMDPENVKEFGWALEGEEVLTGELELLQRQIEDQVQDDPSAVLQGFELSESDRAKLARPEIAQVMREASVEWAVNGLGGWV